MESLEIKKNGQFAFATPLPPNGYYARISLQPQSPAQRCVLRSAYYFTITVANVTDMEIVCSEFSYVANAVDNTIAAFSIDATTGAIASAGPPVSAGVSPVAIAGTSDKKYVYVVNNGSNDVSAFAADPGTGALTAVPGSPFAAGTSPRALALSGDSSLYIANSGSNDITVYQVDQNSGALTPLANCVICPLSTGADPSAMTIGPNSSGFLYVANTGDPSISAFGNDLSPVPGSPFLSGSNVSSLAFGATGKFLYAADASEGAAAIYGYTIKPFGWINENTPTATIDPSVGALTPLVGFPLSLPSCTFIVADQTGTYLYATTGTDLLGYSIDALTGALTLLSGFPIAIGANVRTVSIDPTNQFLYVANGSAGTVTSYTLNAATGALTFMPGSPFAVGTSADYIATF